jgi:hypothetical protein
MEKAASRIALIPPYQKFEIDTNESSLQSEKKSNDDQHLHRHDQPGHRSQKNVTSIAILCGHHAHEGNETEQLNTKQSVVCLSQVTASLHTKQANFSKPRMDVT